MPLITFQDAELAFGLHPLAFDRHRLPELTLAGEVWRGSFPAMEETADVLYEVQESISMEAGTWNSVPDTGTGGMHTFEIPAGGNKIFVRFRATFR